ncbi:MAG: sigma-70 family RNA polymerase sigma factor [Betaproteobacteria bacterium]|nr:sigma-70 family RNA polymerase sigma factor [Betaproteobacteria bacterium]
MNDDQRRARLEAVVLPHLDAAYNLARWLMRDEWAAQDAVQDAALRAVLHVEQQQGPNAKAWFMAIVRRSCINAFNARSGRGDEVPLDDEHLPAELATAAGDGPEEQAMRRASAQQLHVCIESLPLQYREVLVLRELEELSYREIGAIVDVPVGTVMSRLSRARDLLARKMHAVQRRAVP